MITRARSSCRALLALWLGVASTVCVAQRQLTAAECPQPRFTGKAPPEYYSLRNTLQGSSENLVAGETIYLGKPGASSCAVCHGVKGEGNGSLARMFDPRPRNFACRETINGIPDGQLFWIIKFGSPGTAMPDHPDLSDTQIWQLVLQLRRLAR
jgi:hypothetical protein